MKQLYDEMQMPIGLGVKTKNAVITVVKAYIHFSVFSTQIKETVCCKINIFGIIV